LHNRANSCSYSIANADADCFANGCTERRSHISADI
jgi:hypothetical protein